ncbi:ATP-binding cassette sub-family C member 11-like isoform X2 [Malaya genurostris]|uniref:ATP-binding cassette sub-family C member 11-like isoform X2 n=1 Tax=Malaya genurostris TaxID=325434 RepID=UPI0026F37ECE|nr:ATP-binding cassette sub-family C member 11-like isoform X2 [Malaya genurostris]
MRKKLISDSQISLTSTDNDSFNGRMISESEAETSINDQKKVKRRVRNNVRSARVNSAYTPHNRLSRYKTALNGIIPFRVSNTGDTDLPVDNVGCLSNSSFTWIRKFIISPAKQRAYQNIPTNTRNAKQDEIFLLPKRPYSDSCEVNCRRLLGIYKYEETMNGRKNVSMFKVIWRFTRTRLLIASIFHCLAIFLTFLAIVLFSNFTIESMQTIVSSSCQNCSSISNCSNAPPKILGIKFETNRQTCSSSATLVTTEHITDRILLSLGVYFCFFGSMIFNSVKNWLNLRTAIRLRTAVLSSIYKRAMKSNIVNNISAHQLMTMTNEESEILFQIVESGVQLIGIFVGLILTFAAGFYLLPLSGILPLLGVLPLLLLLLITGSISKAYYRKFLAFGARKLSVVEEICLNFKNIKSLELDRTFIDRFVEYLNCQYRALQWCNVYSTKFSGGVTSAILIGGLYLIWCDTNIKTESTEVLILLLIFAFHVQNLMLDLCNCIYYVLQGKAALDKLKQSYQLSSPDSVRLKPNRENLAIQANEVEVDWPTAMNGSSQHFKLYLDSFEVVSGQIIGITGNAGTGKTTLLHTILRNTDVRKGKVLQRGKLAFFPSDPVLMNASLKENVLFGEPMDAQRYYLATNAMKLNEDILQAAGADDIPITYLELTVQQLERIVLARAIYCHRQIILLDEPFNRFTDRQVAKELFGNMLNIFQQQHKTAVIVTQFNELLQFCERVFRIEDGAIYREGSYAEINSMPSYMEMTRISNIAVFCRGVGQRHCSGSDPAALYISKSAFRKSNHLSTVPSGSTQDTDSIQFYQSKHRAATDHVRHYSICDYISLISLHLINNLLYFGPIFTLIVIVEQGDINPWLSTICLGVIVCTFFIDNICKIYVARVTANRNKSYQQLLIKELLRSSLAYLQSTSISDVIDLFVDTITNGFTYIDSSIQQALMIALSLTLLIIANYWTVFIIFVLVPITVALILYLKYSLQHLYNYEHLSKKRMFSILTNHLLGRAVTQSFDYVSNFVQEFYDNVEENSTAIFMYKSIQFFVEFWVNFCAFFVGMLALLLILLLTPDSEMSIHRYTLAMFAYLTLVSSLQRFVGSMLQSVIAGKKIDVLQNNIMDLQTIEETHQPSTLTNSDIGVSVVFKDVVYRVANEKILKIPKLMVQAAETVALTGKGSQLIIPLLCRIISLNKGTVSLNQIDIARLNVEQLRHQIGVIPGDPKASNISVGTFLNPDGKIRTDQVNNVLKEAKLFEAVSQLPDKLDSEFYQLSLKDRQLLCLARCFLKKPSLLLVEQIHPDICDIINSAIQKKFIEQTVIIIGTHEIQYKTVCDRLINLDTL